MIEGKNEKKTARTLPQYYAKTFSHIVWEVKKLSQAEECSG